mmetsp:Transcript_38830/g.97576  ORF Transcript_38830/g.97576 Transcript_38830/m.97576 type:complete len:293 (-) Transcript_38830:624-1502(-)
MSKIHGQTGSELAVASRNFLLAAHAIGQSQDVLLQVTHCTVHLLNGDGSHTARQGNNAITEILFCDHVVVADLQVDHALDVSSIAIDYTSEFEQSLDSRNQSFNVRPVGSTKLVKWQLFVESIALLAQHLSLDVVFSLRFLQPDLVLLEHTFRDDTCEQCQHAEAAPDHEEDQEARENRVLVKEAAVSVLCQIRDGHEFKQAQHAALDSAETSSQQLLMCTIVSSSVLHKAYHQDRTHVQYESHQQGHPKYCLGSFRQTICQQVQLAQEPHYAKDAQDAQQPDDSENSSDAG